jgi:hypothetical protein
VSLGRGSNSHKAVIQDPGPQVVPWMSKSPIPDMRSDPRLVSIHTLSLMHVSRIRCAYPCRPWYVTCCLRVESIQITCSILRRRMRVANVIEAPQADGAIMQSGQSTAYKGVTAHNNSRIHAGNVYEYVTNSTHAA